MNACPQGLILHLADQTGIVSVTKPQPLWVLFPGRVWGPHLWVMDRGTCTPATPRTFNLRAWHQMGFGRHWHGWERRRSFYEQSVICSSLWAWGSFSKSLLYRRQKLTVSKVTLLVNEWARDAYSGPLIPNSARTFSILSHGRFLRGILLMLYHACFTFTKHVSLAFGLSRSRADGLRTFCCSFCWGSRPPESSNTMHFHWVKSPG